MMSIPAGFWRERVLAQSSPVGIQRSAKRYAKKLVRRFGLNVTRLSPHAVPDHCGFKWLSGMAIKTVIDVGANRGEMAVELHRILPDAGFYCFEPLKECIAVLRQRTRAISHCRVFEIAIGDEAGEARLHRSSYDSSSSLRPMGALHKRLFPHTAATHEIVVPVDTLDHAMAEFELQVPILLKLDVQGFEDRIIRGAPGVLARTKVVIAETSFQELYEGQPLFAEIHGMLAVLGFRYMGAWSEDLRSPIDGSHLQQDSVFVRR